MKEWLKKLEVIADRLIPYLLLLLVFIIIIDIFYKDVAEMYKFQIGLLDGFIVGVFLTDLIFKFIRTKNFPDFIKKYWLEILAVFPFYLLFRALELTFGFLELSGIIKQSQNIFHSGIELEKEVTLASREAREVEELGSRAGIFSRTFRSISRAPRLLEASKFFEKPNTKKKNYKKKPGSRKILKRK